MSEIKQETRHVMDLELFVDPHNDFDYKETPALSEFQDLIQYKQENRCFM